MSDPSGETFEEFKKSFKYGSRNDLHFKFLAGMSDEDAAEFLRLLLEILGDAFDTGDYDAVPLLVYEWQVHAYGHAGPAKFNYDQGPFTAPVAPLRDSAVALISAGGVYDEGHDPTDGETQELAVDRISDYLRRAPTLVSIPHDTPVSRLRVRHPGYDIRGALRDPNVIFPIDPLRDLVAEKIVGRAERHYGFVGAASQLRLRERVASRWAQKLHREEVDVCVLVAT